MRHRCCENRRTEGFVLLYTLWLLLGGVAVFAMVSSMTLGRARGTASSAEWLRSTAAAESAAHDAMFNIVARGKRALAASSRTDSLIDGVRMNVDVIRGDGLVDLNSADATVMRRLLAAVFRGDASGLARSIESSRPLRNFAQVVAIEELDVGELACLLRNVTLSSGKATPTSAFAPERLRSALSLELPRNNSNVVAANPDSLAGSSIRIDVQVVESNGIGRRLLVDVLVTGHSDRPLSVLEWTWLPALNPQKNRPSACIE